MEGGGWRVEGGGAPPPLGVNSFGLHTKRSEKNTSNVPCSPPARRSLPLRCQFQLPSPTFECYTQVHPPPLPPPPQPSNPFCLFPFLHKVKPLFMSSSPDGSLESHPLYATPFPHCIFVTYYAGTLEKTSLAGNPDKTVASASRSRCNLRL